MSLLSCSQYLEYLSSDGDPSRFQPLPLIPKVDDPNLKNNYHSSPANPAIPLTAQAACLELIVVVKPEIKNSIADDLKPLFTPEVFHVINTLNSSIKSRSLVLRLPPSNKSEYV